MGNTCGACCGNEGSAEFYTDKKEDAGTKTMSGVNNQDHSKEKSLTMNLAKNTTAGGVGTVFDPTALEIDNERYNNPNVNVNPPPILLTLSNTGAQKAAGTLRLRAQQSGREQQGKAADCGAGQRSEIRGRVDRGDRRARGPRGADLVRWLALRRLLEGEQGQWLRPADSC